jgi:hypothetical protein
LTVNPNFYKTGLFHMYASGATTLFQWGDNGPNKYTATANSLLLYASAYNQPQFALFQRDQYDAAEPWSMFWYNPQVSGAFWDGLPLDQAFDNSTDQWMSMRSSWTDQNALFVAIKAGTLQGHQTHNDLDVGDFVLDALGTRWAGELGDGDYLSPYYFSNDSRFASLRWRPGLILNSPGERAMDVLPQDDRGPKYALGELREPSTFSGETLRQNI